MAELIGVSAAVLTISDSVSAGASEDASGPEAMKMLQSLGAQILQTRVVPDDQTAIAEALVSACGSANLVVTTGGTGVAPSDVTPEATMSIAQRLVPGMAELMRSASLKQTPHAALSRAVVGIRGASLIVNLPGSPGGARDCIAALVPVLPHALRLLQGDSAGHIQT